MIGCLKTWSGTNNFGFVDLIASGDHISTNLLLAVTGCCVGEVLFEDRRAGAHFCTLSPQLAFTQLVRNCMFHRKLIFQFRINMKDDVGNILGRVKQQEISNLKG